MKKSIAGAAMAACMLAGSFGATGVATAKTPPTAGSAKKCRDIPAPVNLTTSARKPAPVPCTAA